MKVSRLFLVFIIFFSIIGQVSATIEINVTEYFDNWDNSGRITENQFNSSNPATSQYKFVQTDANYWQFYKNNDSLALPKAIFDTVIPYFNKISFEIHTTKEQIAARSTANGTGKRYVTIPDSILKSKFYFDNKLPDVCVEIWGNCTLANAYYSNVGGSTRFNFFTTDFTSLNASDNITLKFNSYTVNGSTIPQWDKGIYTNIVIDNSGNNISLGSFWEGASNRTNNTNITLANSGGWIGTTASKIKWMDGYIGMGMSLSDTIGGTTEGVTHTVPNLTSGSFSVWFNTNITPNDRMDWILEQGAVDIVKVRTDDGFFRYFNSTTSTSSGLSYTANSWNSILINFNLSSNTSSYYFNGVLAASDIPNFGAGQNITNLHLLSGDDTIFYRFDEIKYGIFNGSIVFQSDLGEGNQGLYWNWSGSGNITGNASNGITVESNGTNRSANTNHSIVAPYAGRYQNVTINVSDLSWSMSNLTIYDTLATTAQNYIPPTPTNLQNTSGQFWVNYTWQAGAGNATDSYNVSILNDSVLTWYNGTVNPYKNTTTCPGCWVNITIQPWNNSGTGSLNMTPINGSTFIHDPIPILVPPIIDITGIIFDEVNLTYRMSTNFSDIVPGTAKLYYNTTLSGNLSTAFINGSLVSVGIGVYGHSNNYPTNDSVNHTYTVDDDMISPTIGNIIDQYPGTNLSCTTCHRGFDYSTVTSPTNKNNLYKERLYNISALKPYNLLEFSVNTTSVVGQSPLMVFFANHSYTSGNIHTSPYACSLGSIIPTTTFNHDEGGYGVQQIPFAVNTINGTICGIKITEDSYFVLHPESTGWNIYYTNNITRPDQTRYSSNSGVGWSNFSGTLRMHVHQIGDDVWNRHACYNSSSTGNRYCSEVTHDSLGFPDVPPVGAAFTNPDGNNTFLNATNITISWTAGYSLTNGVVLGYNLSLWKQGVKLLQIANLSNTTLSYTWNTSEIGQGSDYNFRMITYSNKSLNTTTASVLFNITQSPNITAYFNDVSGWNQTTTTININNNMMFNVTVDQIVDAVSFQINGSEQQNTSSLSWTHLFNALGDYIITMQANNSNGSSNIVVTHVQVVEGGAVPPCCGGGGTDWDWSQGYVKYSNGTGIEGVLVTTSVGTATTDAVGYYTIGYNFVHGNTYNFNGTKAGYFYNSTNYAFSSGDFTWANLTMSVIPPPATITNPNITSWENGNTSNATLSLFIQKYTNFTFNATANQTIDTWSWIGATFINGTGTTDSYAYHNFTTAGIHYVTVQGTNTTNGSTQIITWTINVVGGTGLSLSGYVMNTLEFPLQNARVDLNGYHVFTSATGYYNFSNISENTYPILARQIGYRNSTQTITISNDTIVNITMKERTAGSVAAPGFSGFSVLLVLGILFYYHKKKPMQGKL